MRLEKEIVFLQGEGMCKFSLLIALNKIQGAFRLYIIEDSFDTIFHYFN